MPLTHVEDKIVSRFIEPDDHERFLSQARHPSSRGSALTVDIYTPYKALNAPLEASWPRATVRPLPRLDGKGCSWAVKLWAAQGVSLIERGLWVAKAFDDLDVAGSWATAEVKFRRPSHRYGSTKETPC